MGKLNAMKKLLILLLFIPLVFACGGSDGDSDSPCPNQPQLTTLEVSNIGYDENTDLASATFSGEIQNIQLGANCETFSITNQGFVYGTNIQPTTSDNVVNANGENASANVSDLMPETTYYVRAYLTNTLGTFYGNEVSFTTPEAPLPPLTNANFNSVINSCLSTNPIDGMCSDSEYGAMPDWDVSQVTEMIYAFSGRDDFNAEISNWDVSNVTNMYGMFNEADSFNQPIGDWDVSNVTDMGRMFGEATSFNQPIGDWDVSSVTTMEIMFEEATSFNQPIGDWDVSQVTKMNGMFWSASSFNQPIGDWDVSSVTDINGMFRNTPFNQPIGDWDVSSVTTMGSVFWSASSFNQPIGDWDVSNVANMVQMLMYADSFNQDLSSWNVDSVTGCLYFCYVTPNWTLPKPNFTNCSQDLGCD